MNKKRITAIVAVVLTMVLVLALSIPAMANPGGNIPEIGTTVNRTYAFNHDNVQRSRVWPLNAPADQGGTPWFTNNGGQQPSLMEYIGVTPFGHTWRLLREDYFCPICGSNTWISYSNQAGAPNGNNIQVVCVGEDELTFDTNYFVEVGFDIEVIPHDAVYQTRTIGNSLSSVAPEGQLAGSNWFRYVYVADAVENGPVEIAASGSGALGITPLGLYYNVAVDGDQLVITLGENIVSARILARADGNTGNQGVGHEVLLAGEELRIPNNSDKLYVHFELLVHYTTNNDGDRIVTSCTPLAPVAFDGDVKITATGADGIEKDVTASVLALEGFAWTVEGVLYDSEDVVIKFYVNGVQEGTYTATLVVADTVEEVIYTVPTFGKVTIVNCDVCQ